MNARSTLVAALAALAALYAFWFAHDAQPTDEESQLARALGRRVATIAAKLSA